MKILHIVPGLDEPTNGIARAAKRIAAEQVALGHEVICVETREFVSSSTSNSHSELQLSNYDVAFVHSMWLASRLLRPTARQAGRSSPPIAAGTWTAISRRITSAASQCSQHRSKKHPTDTHHSTLIPHRSPRWAQRRRSGSARISTGQRMSDG